MTCAARSPLCGVRQLDFEQFEAVVGEIDAGDVPLAYALGVAWVGRLQASDNFKAYAVQGHRHLPEIEQGLSDLAGGPVQVTFVPHLLPMIRGILATLYARVSPDVDVQALFEEFYDGEPFVDVLPAGQSPQTRSVRGANTCRLGVTRPQGRDMVVINAAEDNLVKGASGQAIQAMNIMFGLEERAGLHNIGLLP